MPTTQPTVRYLTAEELSRLRRFAESQAVLALQRGNSGAVRAWALLDTLLSSGLRASEVAALRVGDCFLGYGQSSLLVQHGKGGKTRGVIIAEELKRHLKAFLTWKADREEPVTPAAPLFPGQRGPLTRNGVWRIVKGLMAAVGLDPRYATHTCRHTYATHLYRASGGDLEIVQEQLGHANVKTTTIYAKVTKEDKLKAANALAKTYEESERKQAAAPRWPRQSIPASRLAAPEVFGDRLSCGRSRSAE
ncbi:MAG: tyrosine-type recombinase/integrase [Candidatus Methylomirabilota bacterium]